MPSVSKSQQRLMGMAYAVKSGDMEISDIDPAYRDKVKSLSDGMTNKDLKKYASTKHDDLPETVDENFETANARISPDVSIGGMGEVSLPNAENGNIGSGDVPAVADIDDDEEEAKKDKTKKKLEMEGFKLFTQFNNFITEGSDFDKIYEEAVLENAVRDLHFEIDADKAEDMKIAIGTSQGEVTRRKQIEGGNYSLRRFRKEIKYDETGEDLGVFKPGSYMAATSKLGDGPHKKAVKKIKWNQKMYNQWLEDVASNGGWEHAFDMAQNAKHERGLIDWVKKNHRGEDPMQRIQWDIEAFAESAVTEGVLSNVRKAIAKTQGALKKKWAKKGGYENFGQDEIRDLQDRYGYSSMVYGTPEQRKAAKLIDALDQWAMNYVGESEVTESVVTNENRELMKIDSYLNTKDEDVLVTFLDDYFYNSADKKARKEWDAARDGLGYSDLVDYAVKHADNHGMDLQDMEDAIEVYETKKVKDHFSEYCKLNEAKSISREDMMKFIKKHMSFVGTSEDFNGSEGGIHVSGENYDDEFKGKQIYDYYSEDYKNREFGVLNSWEKELNKRGWYSEWYDAGTVMIWPI